MRDENLEYMMDHVSACHHNADKFSSYSIRSLDNDLKLEKKSETIFILGSGPSINEIKKEQWATIESHDSLAFNHFMIHDFVPSFYVWQSDENISGTELLNEKREAYRGVCFILRGSSKRGQIESLFIRQKFAPRKKYFANVIPVNSTSSISIEKQIKFFYSLGFMDFGNIGRFIPQFTCTLGLIIPLLYCMGYKKIVLLGMDMANKEHFWDAPEFRARAKRLNLPLVRAGKATWVRKRHPFLSRRSGFSVPEYVGALSNWMKISAGVDVYYGTPSSFLEPYLKSYEI